LSLQSGTSVSIPQWSWLVCLWETEIVFQ
jgi:hypothetical protein